MSIPITIVYSNSNGCVTDYGAPVEIVDNLGEHYTVPRYGVWMKRADGKNIVVLTTADLAEAKRKLGIAP